MHIDKYEFGRIVIDGQVYSQDILIIEGKIIPSWWRKEGHYLRLEDITELISTKPAHIIIGTGYSGMVRTDPGVVDYCRKNSIKLTSLKTASAIEAFNGDICAAAGFHLTC